MFIFSEGRSRGKSDHNLSMTSEGSKSSSSLNSYSSGEISLSAQLMNTLKSADVLNEFHQKQYNV